jgi:hypothetical protein
VLAVYTFQVLLLLGDANASSNDCFSEQSTGKFCTLQDHSALLLTLLLLSPDMIDLVTSLHTPWPLTNLMTIVENQPACVGEMVTQCRKASHRDERAT